MSERDTSRKRWSQRSQQRNGVKCCRGIKLIVEIQLLDLTVVSSSGTFAPKDSEKGQRYEVRLSWVEGQLVDGMKIVTVEHSGFKGVFGCLSYFLCQVYACRLCLALNLQDSPMLVEQPLEHFEGVW